MTDIAATEYRILSLGADPTGNEDATGLLQAVFTEAVGIHGSHAVHLPPGATFKWSGTIVVEGDVAVVAHGATLLWDGPPGVTGFVNSVPINLAWRGGTIDGNGLASAQSLFSFGADGTSPASSALLSCVAEDLTFTNVGHGAWTCNNISNANIDWRNLRAYKAADGDGADIFEIDGTGVRAQVAGSDGGTSSFLITSAFLAQAAIDSRTDPTSGGQLHNVELQSYASNGPGPYFVDVDVAANGQIWLSNGDLTAETVVSDDVRIRCRHAANLVLGNSPYCSWRSISVRGTLFLTNSGAFNIGCCYGLDADVLIDGTGLGTSAALHSVVSINSSPNNGLLRFRSLRVQNVASGGASYILGANGGSTSDLAIAGGARFPSAALPLYDDSDLPSLGALVVRSMAGYNPQGSIAVSVPASGGATSPLPYDATYYITASTSGGATAAISAGPSVDVPTGETVAVFVEAGLTLTMTYTDAPTWVVEAQ